MVKKKSLDPATIVLFVGFLFSFQVEILVGCASHVLYIGIRSAEMGCYHQRAFIFLLTSTFLEATLIGLALEMRGRSWKFPLSLLLTVWFFTILT